MKISFIIPAHNEQGYLGRCLESVCEAAKGRGQAVEIIVVNNASTDHTAAVAAMYEGVRVVDEPRLGLSRARQTGFEASSGELIANIDADTVLPRDWITTVLTEFSSKKHLVALSGPQRFYDVPRSVIYWSRFFYYVSYLGYLINRFIFQTSSLLQGGNFVIRRRALEKIGGYNPRFSFYGEDADIAHRLHKIGDVEFTFRLPIYASGRRVMIEGKFTMAFRYMINYFWTILFGRPFTKTAIVIRPEPQKETARW